jgi:phage-related protein
LNDPEKGVTKLMRSGVTFTDQQKKQITTLQHSGKTLEAQKIILREVNKEFGGSAAAQATAGDKFKVAFGNLEESIGTALLPVLDKVLNAGTKFATFLTNDISPNIRALNGYLAPAIASVKEFFSGLSDGGQATGFLTTLKNIGSSIATNFLPVIRTIGTMIVTTVLPVLVRFGSYLVTNLFPIFTKVGNIIATQVIPIIATLAKFFYGTLYPAVIKIVTAVAGSLKPVFDELFAQIQKTVLPIVTKLLEKFREWWPTIKKVIVIVLVVVGALLRLAAAILGKVLPPLIRFAGFLIRTVFTVIIAVIGVIVKIVAAIIKIGGAIGTAIGWFGRFSKAVDAKIRAALGFIKDLPGKAKDALGNLSSLLVDKGKDIVQGLIDGIKKMGSKLAGFVKDFVKDHIPGPVAHVLGISSPSKVMAEQARWIPLGMVKGIDSQASVVDAAMIRLASRVRVSAPRLGFDVASGSAVGAASGNTFQVYETQNPSATARQIERHLAFAGGS